MSDMQYQRQTEMLTKDQQRNRFNWMLDICEKRGWHNVATWVQQSLDELDGIVSKNQNGEK